METKLCYNPEDQPRWWRHGVLQLQVSLIRVTTLATDYDTTEIYQQAIHTLWFFSSNAGRLEHAHLINFLSLNLTPSFVTCNSERFFLCVKLPHTISRLAMWASFIPNLSNWINLPRLLNPNAAVEETFCLPYNSNKARSWTETPALMFFPTKLCLFSYGLAMTDGFFPHLTTS